MRYISWCPCLNTRLPTAPGINTDRINAVILQLKFFLDSIDNEWTHTTPYKLYIYQYPISFSIKKTSYHIHQHSITTTFKAMLHTSKWSREYEAEINLYDLIRNMSLTFHPLPGVPPVEGEVGAWLHVAETLPPSPLRITALLPASIISYEDSIK